MNKKIIPRKISATLKFQFIQIITKGSECIVGF